MTNKKNSGIYQIYNLESGLVYVGRSVDIDSRWNTHKRELRNSNHKNKKLESDFNELGEDKFHFEVMENAKANKLPELELDYIMANLPHVYNVVTIKDFLKYELAKFLRSEGYEVRIDFKIKECSFKKPLSWSIVAKKDNDFFFVDTTTVGKDFPITDEHIIKSKIREDYINCHDSYFMTKVVYSASEDIEEYEKYLNQVKENYEVFKNKLCMREGY